MDAAADPKIEGPGGRRVSFVWLAPLIAVAVALFLLWREYEAQGPLIEISFPTAEGMREGETALRYRDVDVGRVENIRFSDDLSRVIAEVRLQPEVARFVDDGATFWLVRPEVSVRGVTGLDTVLSGVYIEGAWDATESGAKRSFDALEQPPLTPIGAPGKRVTLRAATGGSLNVGAPILFRGIEVGQVEARRLTDDGAAVEFEIFVNAPHDRRLTADTRFWNMSGVQLSIGAEGARLNIASLASLIQGGASFEDLSGGAADPVAPGYAYNLYPTEDDARAQALDVEPGEQLLLDVFFDGSIRGLNVGAPVEYQGIRIGRVASVSAEVDAEEGVFATRTTIAIAPVRLGLGEGAVDASLAFLDRAVARGVRAQLATANLLTGALLVRFVSVSDAPGAEAATIERREGRPPRMPATQTDLDELAGSVEGALKRVERLPIEALFANAVLLLENVNAVVGSNAVRQAPEEALGALAALNEVLNSEAVKDAPGEATALLRALRETVESEEIASARVDLAALLASARAVAATLEDEAVAADAAAAIAALRARLEDPALTTLAASLTESVDAATALLSSPALAETPAALNAALASLDEVLNAPGLTEAPEELRASLASARSILETLEQANTAGEIASAAAAARGLLDDPALRKLADEAAGAAAALRAALGAESADQLPEAAARALDATTALFDQLRAADIGPRAAEALVSVNRASGSVNAVFSQAPALIASLSDVAARADGMLASFDVGSELNYEAVTAIREIRDAARAITELAALIERQPNAFILGR
ncbi:MAG: MlaD family protein [Pseudomonadota bacterium]